MKMNTFCLYSLSRNAKVRLPRSCCALACAASVACVGLTARAAVIIDLADWTLQPNLAGQSFTISVQNTGDTPEFFNGVQLDFIVEDGGPQLEAFGGAKIGPAIRLVSVIAPGTLFAGNNTGDAGFGDFGGFDQMFNRYTTTSSGTVTLSPGTYALATIEFDTTGGIPPGVYSWSAASSWNGASYFLTTSGQLDPILYDGTLTVVPEPHLYGWLGALMCLTLPFLSKHVRALRRR